MELKDTIPGMMSDDYRGRFIAEFDQLMIRTVKLGATLDRAKNGTLAFDLTCPTDLLQEQWDLMSLLVSVMERRAFVEGIDLDKGLA